MRFGHYTVFDTPEENKHTQVYVEYDVPNNDNLEGATGTIVLTEGGQGSGGGGDAGNGIKSITISPAITTTPALESYFPIYWEDLTAEQKQDGVQITINANIEDDVQYTITVTPTADWYTASFDGAPEFGEKGEPFTFTQTMSIGQSYDFHVAAANGTTEETATETVFALLHIGTIPDGE